MSFKHFLSLLLKSARLQQAIDREHGRKAPDWFKLLKLKKIRLMIKDRINVLMRSAGSMPPELQPIRVRSHRLTHYR